jgi:hypothetical protein
VGFTGGTEEVTATQQILTCTGDFCIPPTLVRMSGADLAAGAVHTMALTVSDPFGNTVTDFSGTVHFSSSDPHAALPADYTFTATDSGTHTFGALLATAGTQSLMVIDLASGRVLGTQGFLVTAAAADHFDLSAPSSATAGQSFSVTVFARDRFGNVATGYRGTIHFTSSDSRGPILPADYIFTVDDNGVHAFPAVTLAMAGSQTLTATDTATSSIRGTAIVAVNPAAASTFLVYGHPSPTTAGALNSVIVTAQDAFGNTVTNYQGPVHLSSSDGQASLSANYTFTAADQGTHAFGVILRTAGIQSITATDTASGIAGTLSGIVVTPAVANHLVLTALAQPTADQPFGLMVAVVDQFGNIVSDYQGTVQFASSDPDALLPAPYTFTASDAGVHVFEVTLHRTGTTQITAVDPDTPLSGMTLVLVV